MTSVAVKLETFGRFHLCINETPVLQFANGMQRPWQIFVLLATEREHFMRDKDLIFHLWEESSLKNSKNNLKNAVLRLKKELSALADFSAEPVVRENGGYRLSHQFEFEIDYLRYRDLCDELYNGKKKSHNQLLSIYQSIMDIYQGDFMCPSEAQWMSDAAIDSATQFLEIVAEYCAFLWSNKMYEAILDVYIQVSKVRTPCDELMLYRFRAMSMLMMNRGIIGFYPEARRKLEEHIEPGNPILMEMHEIAEHAYRAVSDMF